MDWTGICLRYAVNFIIITVVDVKNHFSHPQLPQVHQQHSKLQGLDSTLVPPLTSPQPSPSSLPMYYKFVIGSSENSGTGHYGSCCVELDIWEVEDTNHSLSLFSPQPWSHHTSPTYMPIDQSLRHSKTEINLAQANSMATAYTSHPCDTNGPERWFCKYIIVMTKK